MSERHISYRGDGKFAGFLVDAMSKMGAEEFSWLRDVSVVEMDNRDAGHGNAVMIIEDHPAIDVVALLLVFNAGFFANINNFENLSDVARNLHLRKSTFDGIGLRMRPMVEAEIEGAVEEFRRINLL